MGTLAALSPVLGIFFGWTIAKFTKEEIKNGHRNLIVLQDALAAMVVALGWSPSGLWITGAIGIIVFLLLFFLHRQAHGPIWTVVMGASSAQISITRIPAMIYLIVYASLNYKNYKRLIFSTLLYSAMVVGYSLIN